MASSRALLLQLARKALALPQYSPYDDRSAGCLAASERRKTPTSGVVKSPSSLSWAAPPSSSSSSAHGSGGTKGGGAATIANTLHKNDFQSIVDVIQPFFQARGSGVPCRRAVATPVRAARSLHAPVQRCVPSCPPRTAGIKLSACGVGLRVMAPWLRSCSLMFGLAQDTSFPFEVADVWVPFGEPSLDDNDNDGNDVDYPISLHNTDDDNNKDRDKDKDKPGSKDSGDAKETPTATTQRLDNDGGDAHPADVDATMADAADEDDDDGGGAGVPRSMAAAAPATKMRRGKIGARRKRSDMSEAITFYRGGHYKHTGDSQLERLGEYSNE